MADLYITPKKFGDLPSSNMGIVMPQMMIAELTCWASVLNVPRSDLVRSLLADGLLRHHPTIDQVPQVKRLCETMAKGVATSP